MAPKTSGPRRRRSLQRRLLFSAGLTLAAVAVAFVCPVRAATGGHQHGLNHAHAHAHAHGDDEPGHKGHECIHDEIEASLIDAKRDMLEANLAEDEDEDEDEETGRSERRLSSVAPIRFHLDFSRLDFGADVTSSGQDMTCYTGSGAPSSVALSANTNLQATCTSTNQLTPEKLSYLKTVLVPQAAARISDALRVYTAARPSNDRITISRLGCSSTQAYMNCPASPPSSSSQNGVDYILFVTARPTCQVACSTIAWATAVGYGRYNRPVAGHINFGPDHIVLGAAALDEQLATAVHEIAHALGFSSSLYAYYRMPGGATARSNVIQTYTERGHSVKKIVTPTVISKVEEHFACTGQLNIGGEIEDGGSSGTAGSHWEKRVFNNEFMTGTSSSDPVVFSAVTLALFEDMGWYKANYDAQSHLPWGYLQGCDFLTGLCSSWPSDYFCTGSSNFGECTPDKKSKGGCNLVNWGSGRIPAQFQYSSLPANMGGQSPYADYCPRIVPYSSDRGDCQSASGNTPMAHYGEHSDMQNSNGRCFTGTYNTGSSPSQTHAGCHEIACAADLRSYTVKFRDGSSWTYASCPENGGVVSVPGLAGNLNCPPANIICTQRTGCPTGIPGETCSGHGSCQSDLTCSCSFPWSGDDCAVQLCPTSGPSSLECGGSDRGNCTNGVCQCSSEFDGFACERTRCGGTSRGECHGHGTCANQTTAPLHNVQEGDCICDSGYLGEICDEVPGCANNGIGCGSGLCSRTTGACACQLLPNSLQTQQSCRDGSDPSGCIARTGRYCNGTNQTLNQLVSRLGVCSGSVAGCLASENSSGPVHLGAYSYSYFSVDVKSPDYDLGVVLELTNGADAEIFASFDNSLPSTESYTWISTTPNSAGATREEFLFCGHAYDYSQRRNGLYGLGSCSGADVNFRPGTLYISVLALDADAAFNLTVLDDPCANNTCSGHGVCDARDGGCVCSRHAGSYASQPAWSGSDCSIPTCKAPLSGPFAGRICSGNGISCDVDASGVPTCTCEEGWAGDVCDSTPGSSTQPIAVNSSTMFQSGLTFGSTAATSGSAQVTTLNVSTSQLFILNVPQAGSVVTVRATRLPNTLGDPGTADLMLMARRGVPVSSNFDYSVFDFRSWIRGAEVHTIMFRTTANNQDWFLSAIASPYSRARMDYSLEIQGVVPDSNDGSNGCSRLLGSYSTCSGHGTCNLNQVAGLCTCDAGYAGDACEHMVTSVPMLHRSMRSVETFSTTVGPLEPGQWAYYDVNVSDAAANYGSLKFHMEVTNSETEMRVINPVMLVKPGSSSTSFSTVPTPEGVAADGTMFDFHGQNVSVLSRNQTVIVTSDMADPVSAQLSRNSNYQVAIFNKRYSRAALTVTFSVSTEMAGTCDSSDGSDTCVNGVCSGTRRRSLHSELKEQLRGSLQLADPRRLSTTGGSCTCDSAVWRGSACQSLEQSHLNFILKGSKTIRSVSNNGEVNVTMRRGQIRIFRIPQPLQSSQGLSILVCSMGQLTYRDENVTITQSAQTSRRRRRRRRLTTTETTQNVDSRCCTAVSGCATPKMFITNQEPRTTYDYVAVGSANSSGVETILLTQGSRTGRYWLIVQADADASFLIKAESKQVASSGSSLTDSSFIEEVGSWLATTSTGNITLAVSIVLFLLVCCGCCLSIFCSHEKLRAAHAESFLGKTATRLGISAAPPPPPVDVLNEASAALNRANQHFELEMVEGFQEPPMRFNSDPQVAHAQVIRSL